MNAAAQSPGSGATRTSRRRPEPAFCCRSFRRRSPDGDDANDELDNVDGEMPRNPIRGVCPFGLYDMEPIRLCFVNDALGLTPDDVPQNSPLYLDPLVDIPLILSVGEIKADEFKRRRPNSMRRGARKPLQWRKFCARLSSLHDCRTFW